MEIIVSRRIRELMQEEGLNQVKLAEKIGIKQNTISAWLLGKKGTMHSQPLEVGGLFRCGYRLYSWQEELLVHFANRRGVAPISHYTGDLFIQKTV